MLVYMSALVRLVWCCSFVDLVLHAFSSIAWREEARAAVVRQTIMFFNYFDWVLRSIFYRFVSKAVGEEYELGKSVAQWMLNVCDYFSFRVSGWLWLKNPHFIVIGAMVELSS